MRRLRTRLSRRHHLLVRNHQEQACGSATQEPPDDLRPSRVDSARTVPSGTGSQEILTVSCAPSPPGPGLPAPGWAPRATGPREHLEREGAVGWQGAGSRCSDAVGTAGLETQTPRDTCRLADPWEGSGGRGWPWHVWHTLQRTPRKQELKVNRVQQPSLARWRPSPEDGREGSARGRPPETAPPPAAPTPSPPRGPGVHSCAHSFPSREPRLRTSTARCILNRTVLTYNSLACAHHPQVLF